MSERENRRERVERADPVPCAYHRSNFPFPSKNAAVLHSADVQVAPRGVTNGQNLSRCRITFSCTRLAPSDWNSVFASVYFW